MLRKDKEEEYLAISGGFMEVRPDKVIILADACERVDEIDIARAEEAKKRAQETLKIAPLSLDAAAAEASLRRSLARLKVAERKRRKPIGPG
jgi:F-type H+-transporting ATPase subunit epsilon